MWVILSETRKKSWLPWYVLGGLILLLFVVQCANGKYEGILSQASLWWAMHFLPCLALLMVSTLINRIPAKVISPGANKALVVGSWAYLSLFLLSMALEPFARQAGYSTEQHLQHTWFWLFPLNLLLFTGYFLAFWRKTALQPPSEHIMAELAGEKAQKSYSPAQKRAFEMVASGEYEQAFQVLSQTFEAKNAAEYQEVVMLESEYTQLQRNKDLNLIEPENAQRQMNRIVMAMLNYISAMA